MRRGLVLGKFAPFHRGHQLLVETAAAHVDELVVVVYETTWYEVPAETRARWIRTLHPEVHVVVMPDLDPSSYDTASVTEAHASQLRAALGSFTNVFTSERYGDDLAAAFGARHTLVDPERRHVPVSGTLVRADPYTYRAFLDPIVYRSLIRRVVFLGAESTGKTTLARELARRHGTAWVPEYGRELWEARNGALDYDDLESIGYEQRRREDELALEADRLLFCDTNALTTEQWSQRLFGRASPGLSRLAVDTALEYVSFLCEPDFAWVQDGTRETAAAQARFQAAIRADLDRRGVPYVVLTGALEARMAAVDEALGVSQPAPVS